MGELSTGFMTVNEVREANGLPPLSWRDVPATPANLADAGFPADVAAAAEPVDWEDWWA